MHDRMRNPARCSVHCCAISSRRVQRNLLSGIASSGSTRFRNTLPVDGNTAGPAALLQDQLLVDGLAFERLPRSWNSVNHCQIPYSILPVDCMVRCYRLASASINSARERSDVKICNGLDLPASIRSLRRIYSEQSRFDT